METRELVARVFGTGICAVCGESSSRASMAYCLALFTTIQQYSIVLGRFCGERVTGKAEKGKLTADSQQFKAKKRQPQERSTKKPEPGAPRSQKRGERKVKARPPEAGPPEAGKRKQRAPLKTTRVRHPNSS